MAPPWNQAMSKPEHGQKLLILASSFASRVNLGTSFNPVEPSMWSLIVTICMYRMRARGLIGR